jgi:phosphohistidine phosphatase SixA
MPSRLMLLFVVIFCFAALTRAQQLEGGALVKALQHGGYVIVMRHASSPREAPDQASADPENTNLERQLDKNGRDMATAFGKALRDLKIPVGEVLVSPTYRALETARYAQLPNPRPTPELGDNAQSMRGTTQSQADWLRKRVAQFSSGTNTILITHQPNIASGFPDDANVGDGEALIFGPGANGSATVIARVKIEAWPALRGI